MKTVYALLPAWLFGVVVAQTGGLTITASGASTAGTAVATSVTSHAATPARTFSSGSTTSTGRTASPTDNEDEQPLLPAGRQDARGSLDASVPLQCLYACTERLGNYYFCYETGSSGPSNKANFCNRLFCNQETYDQLRQCLNCILANGEESTLPASYTSTFTTPIEYLDQNGAASWLRTLGEQCAAAGMAVQTTSLTATPTTTGPYYTSWTSGGTVDVSVWTGVTQYTEAIFRATHTPTPGESSSQASRSSSGSSQSARVAILNASTPPSGTPWAHARTDQQPSSSLPAAAAASSSGAASRHVVVPGPLAFLARVLL